MQRRDPGKPEDDDGDDSDPMSEDEGDGDEGEGDDVDDDDDGGGSNGGGATKVAGVSPAAAAAAAAAAGAKTAGSKTGAFLPPIEVELQMQQLWRRERKALDLIFASGKKNRPAAASPPALEGGDGGGGGDGGDCDGYRVFFIRALAVPPPRFRPPMHMGDMIAEHPVNVYLSKVGVMSSSLVLLLLSRHAVDPNAPVDVERAPISRLGVSMVFLGVLL